MIWLMCCSTIIPNHFENGYRFRRNFYNELSQWNNFLPYKFWGKISKPFKIRENMLQIWLIFWRWSSAWSRYVLYVMSSFSKVIKCLIKIITSFFKVIKCLIKIISDFFFLFPRWSSAWSRSSATGCAPSRPTPPTNPRPRGRRASYWSSSCSTSRRSSGTTTKSCPSSSI